MAVRPPTKSPSSTAPAPQYISIPGTLSKLKKPSRKPRKSSQTNLNNPLAPPSRKNPAPRIDAVNPSKKDGARLRQLEKEIPALNMVVPPGITKGPQATGGIVGKKGGVLAGRVGKAGGGGKKKGKVFVEDKETMKEILKMVNDTREKLVEGKLEKGRQLEALREMRRKEQEEREKNRKEKLEMVKDSVRRKRKNGKKDGKQDGDVEESVSPEPEKKSSNTGKKKKRVTFALS